MTIQRKYIYLGACGIAALIVIVTVLSSKAQKNEALDKVDFSVFDSPDKPGSGKCMDRQLVWMLLQLEKRTGFPILKWINSGARTPVHNRKVGGVYNSSHKIPVCKAVDIKTPTRAIQRKVAYEARRIGFKRMGIGKTFIHLDVDRRKKQYVAWGYPKGARPPFNPFV